MKAGERYIITTGEYSHYGIRDSFVVLKTFSFDKTLERWLRRHSKDGSFGYDIGPGEQDFLAFLRSEGYVADDKLNEVHLADYSRPCETPAEDADDDDVLVKRTIHVAQCECGERDVIDDHPPRERQCKCGKWMTYEEQSYTGPDISNAPDAGRVRGGDSEARERASGVKSRI